MRLVEHYLKAELRHLLVGKRYRGPCSQIGIPAFQAPIVNVPVPEIAFFKWQRNHGVAEIRLFEFDGKTEEFVAAPPIAVGRARLDKYTILIFFGYTQTDVDDHD